MAPRMVQCVARQRGLQLCRWVKLSLGVPSRAPPSPGRYRRKLSPKSLFLSLMSSASLASITLTASRAGPRQMRPTMATKQGMKGQRVLCSTMDGMEGLRDTQKYPSSDHCKKGR